MKGITYDDYKLILIVSYSIPPTQGRKNTTVYLLEDSNGFINQYTQKNLPISDHGQSNARKH